ncbi:hypothetical protein JTB14_019975 [Gonioctena quinquepunctata]|nr:hypothetical protein JTB14_019975 [Gonioctena quinquepunctata]
MWLSKTPTTPTIPEYFSGKNIFITGATGFIGKVLIEKLLRSCPDVGKIYLLIRPKKGKSPEERIKHITDLPLFDLLKNTHPENLKKLILIYGDVKELELGLSSDDRKTLIDEVNIVYHIAASVRFDDPLKDAIMMNTRGTREVVYLAKEMKHLQVLIHFSTTYCNTDRKVIDEMIYPPHADWRESIEFAENVDSHLLDILSLKYISPLPNTYTFSKSLGEHVINDLCDGELPVIIFRPSIVISTMTEPMPGWIDNFNGPVGILVASGKGVMRSCYARRDTVADYVPCDSVVKAVIMATWTKGIENDQIEKNRVTVYNGSSNEIESVTMGDIINIGKRLTWEMPLNDIIWYPDGDVTSCWYKNYMKLILYQLLPALFVDAFLHLLGRKPMLVRIHRKIYTANNALAYFLINEWKFINTKTLDLEKKLLSIDFPAFNYERHNKLAEPYEYFKAGLKGGRKYLLKESDESMDQAKVHFKRMFLISQAFSAIWYFICFLILVRIFNAVDWTAKCNDFHTYFNTE